MSSANASSGSSQKQPKLKPTCTLCAASKIKCSRDKPECARCQERGLKCEYIVSKRAGRPCQSKKASNNADAVGRPRNDSKGGSDAATGGSTEQPSDTSELPPVSESLIESTTDDSYFTSRHADLLNLSSIDTSSGLKSGFQDSFGAMDTFQSLPMDPLTLPDDYAAYIDEFSGNLNNLPMEDLFAMSPPVPAESVNQTQLADSSPKCDCLGKAMAFLTELRSMSSNTSLRRIGGSVPTIDIVIARNRSILESTNQMLECSCFHDEVLMVIINLIVMQIMTWYAKTVPDQSNSSDEETSSGTVSPRSDASAEYIRRLPTTIDGYKLDGGAGHDRMAAQLVLSELHSVHRLVNKLSSEVKSSQRMSSPGERDRSNFDDTMDLDEPESCNDMASISAQTMKLLQDDLRKRLRTVSLRTVGILQK